MDAGVWTCPASRPWIPWSLPCSRYLGASLTRRVGVQHALDTDYFNRMDALNYAIGHDDGQGGQELDQADVVLVGVSRTSKTPTCIYLAHRGIRAANVPLVPGAPIPEKLGQLEKALIVGLTISPDRLIQIRRNRLLSLRENRDTSYTDMEAVREEVVQARRLYERQGWPVIDVTRRSVEETAAAVLNLLQDNRPAPRRWSHEGPRRHPRLEERGALGRPAGRRRSLRACRFRAGRRHTEDPDAGRGRWPCRHRLGPGAREGPGGLAQSPPGLVIGADQTLDFEGRLHDKPPTLEAAADRLWAMRGRRHALHAAVAVARSGEIVWETLSTSELIMRDFSQAFLEAYISAEGEALLGSVGAYRLEGPGVQLFSEITGDYFSILGLPLTGLLDFLRGEGVLLP
jgi:predicted house-cleaning NTP pyrophosphatase (Maf/HAM1 superfamily)